MFSSRILQLSILIVGIHVLDALFPYFPQKEEIHLTEVVVKIPNHGKRIPRSSIPPKQMSVQFNISSEVILLNLTRNDEINSDVPIYTSDNRGNVNVLLISPSRNSRFYQDTETGASFMIQTNQYSDCMTGLFLHKSEEYVIEPQNCFDEISQHSKYKIAKLKRNYPSDPYSLKSGVDHRWSLSSKEMITDRQKRQITDFKIEIFFVVDFSIYDYWFKQSEASTDYGRDREAKESIRQFYSFVVNGIDVRYKAIQTWYTISILCSGIYIADTPSKSQFVETLKVTTSNGIQVDSSQALNALKTWVQTTKGLPQHDHAMMFTRYDFTREGSTTAAGLAFVGTLCTDQSLSVVEDHFDFKVLTTAAHELGHGLGAAHDGDNNACSSSDHYIMAGVSTTVDNQNPWKFSTCSVNYFTDYINKLNKDNNNCMNLLGSGYDPGIFQKYTSLPGEVFNADSHCRHIVGPESSFCRYPYRQNFSNICTTLWCRATDGTGTCVSSVGGDGLQCGNKKWCISGECKYDECAPPGDEDCLFGDTDGVVLRYHDRNITCSFEDINNNPYVCYQVKSQCCQQCKHFYTGITDCEYGDHTDGCSSYYCQSNPSVCCGTCYVGPVPSNPSEQTTHKQDNPCKETAMPATMQPTTRKVTESTTTKTTTPYKTRETTASTAIATSNAQEIVFILTITFDLIDDYIKENTLTEVQAALILFHQTNGLKFYSITVRNITYRRASLEVQYDVRTPTDSQSVAQMTTLLKDMASGKSNATIEGNELAVSSINIGATSMSIGSSTTNCEIQSIVGPCPAGYTCVESSNGPVCRVIAVETLLGKEEAIYLGVGLALLIIIIVCCICCFNKKRKLKSENAVNNKLSGVTNLAMDDFYKERRKTYYNNVKY